MVLGWGVAIGIVPTRSRARAHIRDVWHSLPPPHVTPIPTPIPTPSPRSYAVGGTSVRALRSVERLRPDNEQWEAVAPMSCERCCPAASNDGRGGIVVSGGADAIYRHANVFATCELYCASDGPPALLPSACEAAAEGSAADAGEDAADADVVGAYTACDDCGAADDGAVVRPWRAFPPMTTPRCAHSLSRSAGGVMYATGGYGGGVSYLDSIECIDLHVPERGWRTVHTLPQPRAFAATCFGPDHCLYVVGGSDNGSGNFASCLKIDPRSGHTHALAPMAARRHAFAGAFAPDGQLYVAGGFEWIGMLTSAECYDPRADRWRDLPPLGACMELCTGAVSW